MKKVIVMFVAMFAFTATFFAQADVQVAPMKEKKEQKAKVEGQAEGKKESWKSLLGLTAEQDAKMKEIGKTYKEKSEAIKNDATADKAQKKVKSAELKQANEVDLKTVLSAGQFTKYVEIQKQRQAEKKAMQGEKAPEKN